MALCNITGLVYLPSGEPARSRTFVFVPAQGNIFPDMFGAVIPSAVWAKTDRDGFLNVTLLDGRYSVGSDAFNGAITVPDAESATFYEVLGGGGSVPAAPTVVSAPSASPLMVMVGDNVTINQGVYANATSVTRTLMQGSVNVTSQIIDGIWSPGNDTDAVYSETPVGPGGVGAIQSVNITVDAQPLPLVPADYHTYATTADAPVSVGAEITSLQARGYGAPLFGIIGNSANPAPTKEADAIRFNGGRQLQVDLSSIPAGDGFILAADFTVRSITGTNQVISLSAGTSQLGALRISGATIQPYIGPAINGTPVNLSAGATAIGQRIVMAIEFDRVAGTVRFWNNGTQEVSSQTLTYSGVMAATRIILGQLGNLSLHRAVILPRAQGAAWTKTFSEVLADFL